MFGFPEVNREKNFHYKTNFLKTVTFQINYARNGNIIEKALDIKKILLNSFPNVKDINQGEVIIKLEKTPILVSKDGTQCGYEFRTSDNNKILSITTDTINFTINGESYLNFETSFREFQNYLFEINSLLNINVFNRVAVRKINLFEFLETEEASINFLSMIFNNNIIENLSNFPNSNNIKGSLVKVDYFNDPFDLKISYGLLNRQNITKDGTRKIATLDLDMFNKTSKTKIEDIEAEMEKINTNIFNVFEYFINDELKKNMRDNGEKHDENS
ncbi:MAG: TIGR04255 family protein [Spirochaetes bacterium]|nr:TIGR04255 family protein [Spirochaetota bacterium]